MRGIMRTNGHQFGVVHKDEARALEGGGLRVESLDLIRRTWSGFAIISGLPLSARRAWPWQGREPQGVPRPVAGNGPWGAPPVLQPVGSCPVVEEFGRKPLAKRVLHSALARERLLVPRGKAGRDLLHEMQRLKPPWRFSIARRSNRPRSVGSCEKMARFWFRRLRSEKRRESGFDLNSSRDDRAVRAPAAWWAPWIIGAISMRASHAKTSQGARALRPWRDSLSATRRQPAS